jgi:hypothetical protein
LKVCEGKISEGQIEREALDAQERIGPAELEKSFGETSRGPWHYRGPPRKRTDVTQNVKTRQCLCEDDFDCAQDGYVVERPRDRKSGGKTAALQKKKNALAQGVSCGRLASIAAPLI